MKKRITAMALALAMVMGTVALAAGTEKTISVTAMNMTINGQAVTPTKSNGEAAEVFAYDGATYVPLRYLSELLGIQVEWDKDSPNTAKLVNVPNFTAPGGDGTYTGKASGFGGEVVATVTVVGGKITACTLVGDKETPAIGGAALETLKAQVEAAGSAAIDGVAGATMTSNGAKTAVADALAQAGSGSAVSLTLRDGTYTASARGFDLLSQVPVTVTVTGGKLSAIEMGENKETMGMSACVKELLIPRILEHQSLAVDAITGATATSNAVKMAVLDCCKQVGAVDSALYAAIPASTAEETYTVDVAVVGMGGSGSAAALSAVQSGASVMSIDKAGKWGGTSAITSGPAAVNAPSQVAAEYKEWADPITKETRVKKAGENLVDRDALYKDWVEYTTVNGKQHAKTDIISLELDKSGETLDWLIDNGFQFDPAKGFVGGKWGIFTSYSGNKALTESFFANLYKAYTDKGGKYMLETEATELITDGGKVVGVKAIKADGTKVTIHAKSVILATGGFGGSDALMEQYLGESWRLYGMAQNDGAGVRMAVAAGANTYNADMPPMSHFVAPYQIMTAFTPADNDIPYGLVATGESLAVDQTGTRKMAESSLAMNAYTMGAKYYTIWSKEQIDILRTQGLSAAASGRYLSQGGVKADVPLTNIDAVIDEGVKMGFIYKADSLEALAKAIGGKMDAAALTTSVKGYQEAAKGSDPLGKKAELFTRMGAPASESEYYVAITGAPYIYSTCGALDVDVTMRVLNKAGAPIPGLYAVGTDSMGVLFTNTKGYTNYGGIAQGYAFVSGKTAGAEAAKFAGK